MRHSKSVFFLRNPPLTQQEVQVETDLISVHADIVTLLPVPGTCEEELLESMTAQIDADALTPAPRGRSKAETGHPMCDSANSIIS